MQVTSLLSQHEHDHDHGGADCSVCGHDHAPVRLWQTLIGVVFVLNAYVVDWLFQSAERVSSASALLGAVILGYPIVVTSVKDLWKGILSINELVGIAIIASFASGEYKTAGVVAFFMLMGEIINPHRGRRPGIHRIAHQADPHQGPPHRRQRRAGSRRQGSRRG